MSLKVNDRGEVYADNGGARLFLTLEDVEAKIKAGKLTAAQIQKIKTYRSGQMVQNIPTAAHNEKPLALPSVMGNPTPAPDNKPLEMPSMNFTPKTKQTKTASKSSKSKSGEQALDVPVMKF